MHVYKVKNKQSVLYRARMSVHCQKKSANSWICGNRKNIVVKIIIGLAKQIEKSIFNTVSYGSAVDFPSYRPRDRITRNAPNGRAHRQCERVRCNEDSSKTGSMCGERIYVVTRGVHTTNLFS